MERASRKGTVARILFVSAMFLVLVTYQNGVAWAATFSDDFNDGNADGWVVDVGDWSVIDGAYQQSDSSLGRMPSHISGSNYSDFDATVEAQIISSPDRERELGIYFRASADLQTYYLLRVLGGNRTGDDHFQLFKYEDGVAVYLQQTKINYPSDGTWLVVKISANGNLIKAKLWEKGTPEPSGWNLTVTDSTYTSGLFALETYHAAGRFDNVLVTYPTYTIAWLPPVSLDMPMELGSTIPIRFSAMDAGGNFVKDTSVRIEVYDPGNVEVFSAVYGTGPKGVNVTQDVSIKGTHYAVNFPTDRSWPEGIYIVRVGFSMDDVSAKSVLLVAKPVG